jgi:hypothetical protein
MLLSEHFLRHFREQQFATFFASYPEGEGVVRELGLLFTFF